MSFRPYSDTDITAYSSYVSTFCSHVPATASHPSPWSPPAPKPFALWFRDQHGVPPGDYQPPQDQLQEEVAP